MITVLLLAFELPIIAAGGITAAWFAVDHAGRAAARAQELRDIDAWLDQIRATRPAKVIR